MLYLLRCCCCPKQQFLYLLSYVQCSLLYLFNKFYTVRGLFCLQCKTVNLLWRRQDKYLKTKIAMAHKRYIGSLLILCAFMQHSHVTPTGINAIWKKLLHFVNSFSDRETGVASSMTTVPYFQSGIYLKSN